MRTFKTSVILPPLDLWYKNHKHMMNPNQKERFDELYDRVLESEDDPTVNMEERMVVLNEYVKELEEKLVEVE